MEDALVDGAGAGVEAAEEAAAAGEAAGAVAGDCPHAASAPTPPPDVTAFFNILGQRKILFLRRRAQYGDHMAKHARFPSYLTANLYSKCVRVITAVDEGKALASDTLLDLGNYADMVLSLRVAGGAKAGAVAGAGAEAGASATKIGENPPQDKKSS